MTLETSRKILKIAGILTIIAGIATLAIGILSIAMGGVATTMPEAEVDEQVQTGIIAILAGGALGVIGGIMSLVEGSFCVSASKTGKHATGAWIFSIIGLILCVVESVSTIKGGVANTSDIVSIIVGIILNVLVFVAAKNVKNATNI